MVNTKQSGIVLTKDVNSYTFLNLNATKINEIIKIIESKISFKTITEIVWKQNWFYII
ncbi:hypothetical protein HYE05_02925 [Mycoplasmopsis bovis]|nr:hypothetical protein HYE05_02925 [Mycoplasmopsis bovis]